MDHNDAVLRGECGQCSGWQASWEWDGGKLWQVSVRAALLQLGPPLLLHLCLSLLSRRQLEKGGCGASHSLSACLLCSRRLLCSRESTGTAVFWPFFLHASILTMHY